MPASPEQIEDRNRRLTDLLHACAQRRQAAFQELYQQVSPQLFAVLVRILKRRDLAEEALQDALVSVWRNAGSYTAEKGAPMTWLISICRYRAVDILRREQREVSMELVLDEAAEEGAALSEFADGSADTAFISKAESRALEQCLQRLNDGQRKSLTLAYFDGCTHEEIAAVLKSPIGTVKSWVRRGLESLKHCLEAA
jgi:RNA polymerase sigma-70 factor (ECF subfamily)